MRKNRRATRTIRKYKTRLRNKKKVKNPAKGESALAMPKQRENKAVSGGDKLARAFENRPRVDWEDSKRYRKTFPKGID